MSKLLQIFSECFRGGEIMELNIFNRSGLYTIKIYQVINGQIECSQVQISESQVNMTSYDNLKQQIFCVMGD